MNPPLESGGRSGTRYSLFNFRSNIHPSIDKKHRSGTKDRDGQPRVFFNYRERASRYRPSTVISLEHPTKSRISPAFCALHSTPTNENLTRARLSVSVRVHAHGHVVPRASRARLSAGSTTARTSVFLARRGSRRAEIATRIGVDRPSIDSRSAAKTKRMRAFPALRYETTLRLTNHYFLPNFFNYSANKNYTKNAERETAWRALYVPSPFSLFAALVP